MISDEEERIIKEAVDQASQLMQDPAVPKDQIDKLIVQMQASSAKLKYSAVEVMDADSKLSKRYEKVARTIDNMVSALKYLSRHYRDETFRNY